MIKFAGVELLLEDWDGEVSKHVQRYLEWPQSLINPPSRTIDSKCRVQRPQWPEPPQLKPNQLYWPTGATRWGQFIGLATTEQKDAIIDALPSRVSTGILTFGVNNSPTVTVNSGEAYDGTFPVYGPFTVNMYLLPPFPVSQNGQTVWLIPLVDFRYWWQTSMFVSTAGTWADLLDEIEASIGATIQNDGTEAFEDAYQIPDGCIFRSEAINAASALDLLCWATNRRLCTRGVGGDPVIRTLTTAEPLYQAQRTKLLTSSSALASNAGGESDSGAADGDVPVDIAFHFTNDGTYDFFVYHQPFGSSPAWSGGGIMDVMCPAVTGVSDATLEATADKWSADWWHWQKWRYSWSWNSIVNWYQSGYEDYVLFDMSREDGEPEAEDGDDERNVYIARTFVKTFAPQNFGYDFVPIQLSGYANRTCDCVSPYVLPPVAGSVTFFAAGTSPTIKGKRLFVGGADACVAQPKSYGFTAPEEDICIDAIRGFLVSGDVVWTVTGGTPIGFPQRRIAINAAGRQIFEGSSQSLIAPGSYGVVRVSTYPGSTEIYVLALNNLLCSVAVSSKVTGIFSETVSLPTRFIITAGQCCCASSSSSSSSSSSGSPTAVGVCCWTDPASGQHCTDSLTLAQCNALNFGVAPCWTDNTGGTYSCATGNTGCTDCGIVTDCDLPCVWLWTGFEWRNQSNNCNVNCPTCPEPDFPGTVLGESTTTDCQSSSSSSAPCGTCQWKTIENLAGDGLVWSQQSNSCTGICACTFPTDPPAILDQVINTDCA